jgi:hypothetical protein
VATAAIALIIGIVVGHGFDFWAPPHAQEASATSTRSLTGDTRLLLDQNFERFGRRTDTRRNAVGSTPSSTPPASSPRKPASREVAYSEEG